MLEQFFDIHYNDGKWISILAKDIDDAILQFHQIIEDGFIDKITPTNKFQHRIYSLDISSN